MIEFLFLDLDDTILDFHKAEHNALRNTLQHFAVAPTEEHIALYLQINREHWQRFEKGEINRKQVNEGRFLQLFARLNQPVDGSACAAYYLSQLALTHDFLPGVQEAVQRLHQKYRLFIASNGNGAVQGPRMTASGLYPYFEKVFVSEELGKNKPSKAFFDLCFAQIPGFNPSKAMMVGDSLTSDIQGGIHAGIRTCWVNPSRKPNTTAICPDYEIASITELEALLETL